MTTQQQRLLWREEDTDDDGGVGRRKSRARKCCCPWTSGTEDVRVAAAIALVLAVGGLYLLHLSTAPRGEYLPLLEQHELVFVVGSHHSGTSLINLILGKHPEASSLSNTHQAEDEGQHLQNVYDTAQALGGMFNYAYSSRAHLDENSDLVTSENRDAIYRAWRPYWDMTKVVLVEKSPRHVMMTRFLQALFREEKTTFIYVLRHPLAVWNFAAMQGQEDLAGRCGQAFVHQWLKLQETMVQDIKHLERVKVIQYEHLVGISHQVTQLLVDKMFAFIGVDGSVQIGQDDRGNEVKFAQLYRRIKQRHPGAFDSEGRFVKSRFPHVQLPDGYRPGAAQDSRADSMEPRNHHHHQKQQQQQQQQQEEQRRRISEHTGELTQWGSLADEETIDVSEGQRHGRRLLEYWGSRKQIVVHSGSVHDWVRTWDGVDLSSSTCRRVFERHNLFKRVEALGYSLTDLKAFFPPPALKEYMLDTSYGTYPGHKRASTAGRDDD